MNVLAKTSMWSRQCPIPDMIDSRDNFAPCIKNNKAMAAVVRYWKPVFIFPSQGNILAITTTQIMISKKGSIFNLANKFILLPNKEPANAGPWV
ncbi:hypothetical protein OOA_05256 [Providencia burhodogranariea DSM 19968]|uniref:Uncharacterized protein n=1 Tax=Providencia burhodogranariea DSM 19968 TaxID=1141662 RepID=K8WTG5_9GAMM|nr:hypothetical protein OOA_05256 [Providencia burhodogranariea DSM 19968]